VDTINDLDLHWPEVSPAEHEANVAARKQLDAEVADLVVTS
jgi:hypothetical protein